MSQSLPFAVRLQTAYRSFYRSIPSTQTSEHDVRARFIEHVVKNGFGYQDKYYVNEKNSTDILLFDVRMNSKKKEPLPVVVIETKDYNKVDNRSLGSQSVIAQAFRYVVPGATRYVALTNFKRFILWRVERSLAPQRLRDALADIDLEAQFIHQTLVPADVNKLTIISFEELGRFYDDFSSSMGIDLQDPLNFEAFTRIVKTRILDQGLIPQCQRLAQTLDKKFSDYESLRDNLERQKTMLQQQAASHSRVAMIDVELRNLDGVNRDAIDFLKDFRQCESEVYHPSDTTKHEEKLSRFASETAYTLLSRMLLVRIGEDKGILSQNISDGELVRKIQVAVIAVVLGLAIPPAVTFIMSGGTVAGLQIRCSTPTQGVCTIGSIGGQTVKMPEILVSTANLIITFLLGALLLFAAAFGIWGAIDYLFGGGERGAGL